MPKSVVHPHGTRQRYYQEVKLGETCAPCRKAAADHAKAKRLERARMAPASKPRRNAHRAAAKPGSRAIATVDTSPIGDQQKGAALERRIHTLRAELAGAEAAFLAHVAALIPTVEIPRA